MLLMEIHKSQIDVYKTLYYELYNNKHNVPSSDIILQFPNDKRGFTDIIFGYRSTKYNKNINLYLLFKFNVIVEKKIKLNIHNMIYKKYTHYNLKDINKNGDTFIMWLIKNTMNISELDIEKLTKQPNDYQNKDGYTLQMLIAYNRHPSLLCNLLQKYSHDPNIINQNGNTTSMILAGTLSNYDNIILDNILKLNQTNLDIINKENETLAYIVVKYLIDNKYINHKLYCLDHIIGNKNYVYKNGNTISMYILSKLPLTSQVLILALKHKQRNIKLKNKKNRNILKIVKKSLENMNLNSILINKFLKDFKYYLKL